MSHGDQRFSIIPAPAVTDARLEPRDLQVLCLLGRHTDRRGWCCRSQVKMAREIRCGRATVQRSLARLIDAGYLEHRPKQRESGADAAHDYRVILDTPDGGEFPPHEALKEGVPTGGQGCPPMGRGAHPDGQGVPTHERAPMLTTPVKRSERERAREDEEFEAALKAWPSGFADSREDARSAWDSLTPDEQTEANSEIGRFVSTTKAIGRKHFCKFADYLREKRWMALPERPLPGQPSGEPGAVAPAKPMPRPKPTAFQRANPHLFPELFAEAGQAAGP